MYQYDFHPQVGSLKILDACAECSKCTDTIKCSFCAEYLDRHYKHIHSYCEMLEKHQDGCILCENSSVLSDDEYLLSEDEG
jgi:hypothetical protein